jgi:hypothetical protein
MNLNNNKKIMKKYNSFIRNIKIFSYGPIPVRLGRKLGTHFSRKVASDLELSMLLLYDAYLEGFTRAFVIRTGL